MLQHGADPRMVCLSKRTAWAPMPGYGMPYGFNHYSLDGGDHSLERIIRDVFGEKFPDGAVELLQLVEEKKKKKKSAGKNPSWSRSRNKKRQRLR